MSPLQDMNMLSSLMMENIYLNYIMIYKLKNSWVFFFDLELSIMEAIMIQWVNQK